MSEADDSLPYDLFPQTPSQGLALQRDALTDSDGGDASTFTASDLPAIMAVLPAGAGPSTPIQEIDGVGDRMLGGWTGRIAGNMLGKPVEFGWDRHRLAAYFGSRHERALHDYFPVDDLDDAPRLFSDAPAPVWDGATRGRIAGATRDDDIDYTIAALELLESRGSELSTADVARFWLTRLPVQQTFTAERVAYRNLVAGATPAAAGDVDNPYSNWIGAMIRADGYGFACAGRPRAAAMLAYRDARLSHRENGLYAGMWAAALVALAFTAVDARSLLAGSLDHIPRASQLAAEITAVCRDHEAGSTWDDALDALDARHRGRAWAHSLNNAGALTAALLWGEGDFGSTIGLAVLAGLDTDSVGASAGSVAGIMAGYDGIPAHWKDPLRDRTRTGLFGLDSVSISELARRTVVVAQTIDVQAIELQAGDVQNTDDSAIDGDGERSRP